MPRIFCAFLCLFLSGCGWFSSSEGTVLVTGDDLIGLEERLNGRIDGEVQELSTGIGNCQVALREEIDGVRKEFHAHRDATNAVLRPDGKVPITTDLLQEMAESLKERRKQKEGTPPRELAYGGQPPAPPPPKEDDSRVQVQTTPAIDLARFFVKDRTQNCMIIQDRRSGQWYRWNFQPGSGQLVALYQNGCNCGKHWFAVNVDFQGDRIVFPNGSTVLTPGFPTP